MKKTLIFIFLIISLVAFNVPCQQETKANKHVVVEPEMVFVEGGTFMMGCTGEQGEEYYWERPAHEVTVSSFYIGKYEITQKEWVAIMGNNPSHFRSVQFLIPMGIYDMTGNVWEWCSDWYGLYPDVAQTNPQGPTKGTYRIVRGGGWHNDAKDCRITLRNFDYQGSHFNGLGFRIALSL